MYTNALDLIKQSKFERNESNRKKTIVDSNDQFNLSSIKFSTIELPKYDCKYEIWLKFRDMFESIIHNNMSITNIQNFIICRLQGEAAQVIEFC